VTILFSSAAGLSCIFYVHVLFQFGRELHIREYFKKSPAYLDCSFKRSHPI